MFLLLMISSLFSDGIFSAVGNAAIGSVVNAAVSVVAQPVEFSWGPMMTSYCQGIALVIAFFVIVVNGVKTGILVNGSSEDESVGYYLFRSMWPLAVIACSPAILASICTAVELIIADLSVSATSIDYTAMLSEMFSVRINPVTTVISGICALVAVYYTVVVIGQCIRRQFQLTVLSIIGPLVAATTVSESNSGDFVTLMKEMLGTGLVTALQVAALFAAISLPVSASFDWAVPSVLQPFVIAAAFGACKWIPDWIESYTKIPSVASRGNGRTAMMAVSLGRSIASAMGRR